MDTDQAPAPAPRPSRLHGNSDERLPAAAFLRYEDRADGWSAGRQAAFLSHLADHGVVEDAARSVGKHVSGGYTLRREARGYAFNLGWEAALIIARRIVADRLMAAAIRGEESRWVREDNVTTYVRQNTKLSLTLLDRVNPATTLPEVMAVATRFDWFLQLLGDGVAAEELWELFFDDALPHSEKEARDRVRVALLLTEDSAGLECDGDGTSDHTEHGDDPDESPPIEYKSMDGPPSVAFPIEPQILPGHMGWESIFDLAQCNRGPFGPHDGYTNRKGTSILCPTPRMTSIPNFPTRPMRSIC